LLLATGWAVGDAIIGKYLNPRILNVDMKMFFLFNVNVLGNLAMSAVMFLEAYQRDRLIAAMVLLMSYILVLSLVVAAYQV